MARWVLLRTNMRNTSLPTLALSDLAHVLGGCKKGCQMQQQQVVNNTYNVQPPPQQQLAAIPPPREPGGVDVQVATGAKAAQMMSA